MFIVGSTLLGALLLNHVEVVLGFAGAVGGTMISYVLPAMVYLRLRPASAATTAAHVLDVGFLLLGATAGCLGLFNNVLDVL